MGQEQFAAIMPYISADLVGMIAKKKNISENDAITKLYNSKLYATLEQEDTKVWQYSTDMLNGKNRISRCVRRNNHEQRNCFFCVLP